MKTFNLEEAALFLKMTPSGLRRKAAEGVIPGAKPGKRWCFREDHLAEYLQSLYADGAKFSQGVIVSDRRNTWRYIKEAIPGGLVSVTVENEYNKLLERETR